MSLKAMRLCAQRQVSRVLRGLPATDDFGWTLPPLVWFLSTAQHWRIGASEEGAFFRPRRPLPGKASKPSSRVLSGGRPVGYMTTSLNLAFGVDRKAGAGYSEAICVQARWVDSSMTNAEAVSIAQPLDAFRRPLRSLRISVTDRCNLRCRYCMPEEEYVWLEREAILTFEETARLAGIFLDLGVDRLRLTGGEPLLRRQLPDLVRMLKETGLREAAGAGAGQSPSGDGRREVTRLPLSDLALTTNGVLLASQVQALRDAGLDRITVSLDTLRPERFRQFARRDALAQVLEGVGAAREAGFRSLKINTVVMRGFNDDELADLMDFGRENRAEVRFIEYMDVGGATHWSMSQVVSRQEILERLSHRFGAIEPRIVNCNRSAPADRFVLRDGTTFGIIASTTQPFCAHCDRARLTPDGLFLLCLYARYGVDLKAALRRGATSAELQALIAGAWQSRRDRGAEERKAVGDRGPLVPVEALRRDPHLEMHTRGG